MPIQHSGPGNSRSFLAQAALLAALTACGGEQRTSSSTASVGDTKPEDNRFTVVEVVPGGELSEPMVFQVLADEGAEMGGVHPIAWYHECDGGRAWYTGLGHTDETYSEQAFLDHLAGGILWALDGD